MMPAALYDERNGDAQFRYWDNVAAALYQRISLPSLHWTNLGMPRSQGISSGWPRVRSPAAQ
jgi:hypothetical protein